MIVMLLVVIIAFGWLVHSLRSQLSTAEREIKHYRQKYLYKSGMTTLWSGSKGKPLSYQLQSFDGGNTWYVCEWHGAGQDYLQILGKVEVVYPGLLEHLDNMDKLTSFVEKNGPLNLNDSAQQKLLQSVGFQLQTNGTK